MIRIKFDKPPAAITGQGMDSRNDASVAQQAGNSPQDNDSNIIPFPARPVSQSAVKGSGARAFGRHLTRVVREVAGRFLRPGGKAAPPLRPEPYRVNRAAHAGMAVEVRRSA
jgi:hypothetical protein